MDQDQPIQIDAATLEVRDKERWRPLPRRRSCKADMTIKCQKLVVFTGPSRAPPPMRPRPSGSNNNRSSQRRSNSSSAATGAAGRDDADAPAGHLQTEARAASRSFRDQTASGDLGVSRSEDEDDYAAPNVTVAQGKNVLHGERVVVDTVSATPISIPTRRRKMERRRQTARSCPCGDLAE
jgi:lipopolysaccharide export system protein LptA